MVRRRERSAEGGWVNFRKRQRKQIALVLFFEGFV